MEESSDEEFSNPKILQLHDTNSITLTGMKDGSYYYRIKDSNNQSSNVVNVTVEHHSLVKAFLFFSLGLCLFIILLYVLSIGHTSIKIKSE